jgi:hypothetical protein
VLNTPPTNAIQGYIAALPAPTFPKTNSLRLLPRKDAMRRQERGDLVHFEA